MSEHAEALLRAADRLARRSGLSPQALEVQALLRAAGRLAQAAESLGHERDQLREVYDRAYEFLGVLRPDGTVLDANQTVLRFGGSAREEVVGRPFWQAPLWRDDPERQSRLRRAIDRAATGEFVRYDADVTGASGQEVVIDFSLMPVRDAGGGGRVRLLVAEGRDITDRVCAERAATLSQAYLQGLLEHVQDGIVACDAQGRLSYFNRASREFHGQDMTAVDPRDWAAMYDLYRADGRTPMLPEEVPLYRAWKGETVQGVEMVIAAPYAPRRTVVASGSPLRGERGEALGAVVAMHDITARKNVEDSLRHSALHDRLTGLPNRTLLYAALERVMEQAARGGARVPPYAVLFLDLDNFKDINDAFGHLVGDRTLLEVAARLRGAVRPGDLVARLGGDEFALLLRPPCDEAEVLACAAELHAAVAAPLMLRGQSVVLTTSIGAALGQPHYHRVDEPVRDADTAMYRAKRRGKDRTALFDRSMQREVLERLHLERELRAAVHGDPVGGELRLHYQPIMRLSDHRCVGFEALLRWQHPTRGLLPPDAFIELAEQTGLIAPLGAWVLREGAGELALWRAEAGLGDLTLSVNLSALQLQRHAAAEYHPLRFEFPPGLSLEITESALIEASDAAQALQDLAARGVRLALDDFGTGFASLSALQRHPFHSLKIDRSFTGQLPGGAPQLAIIESVTTLARGLNLQVVAEGIETPEQLDCLVRLGCSHGQGYLFSRPLPPHRARTFARTYGTP